LVCSSANFQTSPIVSGLGELLGWGLRI